ncbi:MAG: hypothetical protein Q7J27_09395 [Syntrophales bacterium]|nr:hypothetical protein [Syntrophales bacterium]
MPLVTATRKAYGYRAGRIDKLLGNHHAVYPDYLFVIGILHEPLRPPIPYKNIPHQIDKIIQIIRTIRIFL